MTRNSSKVLVVSMVAALLFIAMVGGATAAPICDIDSTKLNQCRPAVTGKSPPPPTKQCCNLVRYANLPCLCNFKSVLPAFGINPAQAMALPKKCGLKTPPECQCKFWNLK